MAYPVVAVRTPAVLANTKNGLLLPSILVATPGLAGGPKVLLVEPAARAWRALQAAAQAAGHILKATSAADSYRPYAVQQAMFSSRYSRAPMAGYIATKTCGGVTYYQRPHTAVAACPGTSNHGWGLAIDTGEERDSDAAAEPLDDPTLDWLVAHELQYGFSHELQSEPWHIRYWAGDNIPAAVLAYERGPAAPTQEETMRFKFDKGIPGADTAHVFITDGLRYRILSISYQVDAAHAKAGAGPIVVLGAADLPKGWTYEQLLAAVCGSPDPGELSGGDPVEHTHAVRVTLVGEGVGATGPAQPLDAP